MSKVMKRLVLGMIAMVCLTAVVGCSRSRGVDLSIYLNNTLEYFIDDTKVEVTLNENEVYWNEKKGIQITVKDNLIQKVELVSATRGYQISNLCVGDKQKKAEKILSDLYGKKTEVTKEDGKGESYQYQKANKQLTVTYGENHTLTSIAMEVTAYIVDESDRGSTGESKISKDQIMVTVGNIEVSYSEAMVYLRTAQQIYETEFGNDVWGFDVKGNGTTIGAVLKQEVLDQIIQLEIINIVANEKGITLSDDEMFQVRGEAVDFMQKISVADQQKYGITEELVVQVFATNLIAEKLYETVTIDVDTDVTDEQAQQCRINRLFIKNYGMDSKGNRTELRSSELKEIRKRVKELHKQALETSNFYSLAEANSDDKTIERVVGRGDLPAQEEQVAFSLKDGEVSDILEEEDGFAILYCVDAYDEDATLQVKEKIIEQRRSDLFIQLYTEWYSKYDVRVNMNLWNRLELLPLEQVEPGLENQ